MTTKRTKRLRTAREVIRIIARFLAAQDPGRDAERAKLWSVLAALRGPDGVELDGAMSETEAKCAATEVIRRAFYGTFEPGNVGALVASMDTGLRAKSRRKLSGNGQPFFIESHFTRHAQRAFKALGLSWESANSFEVLQGKRRRS